MSYVRFMNDPNIMEFLSAFTEQNQGHHGDPRGAWGWPYQGGWSPFDGEDGREHEHWTREMPHHPRRHGHGPHGHGPHGRRSGGGPPPPPGAGSHPHPPPFDGERPVTPPEGGEIHMVDNDDGEAPDPEISAPPADDKEGSDSNTSDEGDGHRGPRGHRHHGRRWGGRGGRHFGGRGGFGGFGHPWRGAHRGHWGAGWGPYHQPPYHRHGGPFGGPHGRRGPQFGPQGNPLAQLAGVFGLDPRNFDAERLRNASNDFLQNVFASTTAGGNGRERSTTLTGNEANEKDNEARDKDVDFRPLADIYDAKQEYVVHFALPGANKEDISLNWDAEHSELQVAGVIARDGDEETIQALALAERDVGVFERKVKLGREGVDAEGITAKMENGLLVVRVPKRIDDEWTEVKKVDIA